MMKKCSCILKTAAALVSAVLLTVPAAAGPLCYEDEYIGLKSGAYEGLGVESGSDRYDLYDSEGKLCGSIMDRTYDNFTTVPKGVTGVRYEGGTIRFVDTDTFETLYEFEYMDNESYEYASDSFSVYNQDLNTIKLYDFTGNLIAETKVPELRGFDRTECSVFSYMFRPDGATVIHLWFRDYNKNNGNVGYINCIWKDGSWSFSTEPDSPAVLKGAVRGTIGKYLLIGAGKEGESERFDVCTTDGTIIMRHVMADVPELWGESLEYIGSESVPVDRGRVCFVSLHEGNIFRIFDEELNDIAGLFEDIDELHTRPGYAAGLPADVLKGRFCEGTLTCGKKDLLYAREGGLIYVEGENDPIGIPLPEGETPIEMNDRYILTKGGTMVKQEESYTIESDNLYVRNRENGECVLDSADLSDLCVRAGIDPARYNTGDNTEIALTQDGIQVTIGEIYRAKYDDEFYCSVILDNDLNVTFSTQTSKLVAAGDFCYYYESGPYIGLIDQNGNWLKKLLPFSD